MDRKRNKTKFDVLGDLKSSIRARMREIQQLEEHYKDARMREIAYGDFNGRYTASAVTRREIESSLKRVLAEQRNSGYPLNLVEEIANKYEGFDLTKFFLDKFAKRNTYLRQYEIERRIVRHNLQVADTATQKEIVDAAKQKQREEIEQILADFKAGKLKVKRIETPIPDLTYPEEVENEQKEEEKTNGKT